MEISIRNRQRTKRINLAYLRNIVRALLKVLLPEGEYELAIHLIATDEIIQLNETYVRHEGPTDVITFDYSERVDLNLGHPGAGISEFRPAVLCGEIFVCVDVAITQAGSFRTTWQSEVVRYVIHGILHLRGFDDRHATSRRVMKREESRLLRLMSRQFNISRVASRA